MAGEIQYHLAFEIVPSDVRERNSFVNEVRSKAGNIFRHKGAEYQLDFLLDCDEEQRSLTLATLDNAEKVAKSKDRNRPPKVFQIETIPNSDPCHSFNLKVKVLSVLSVEEFRERCGG